MFLFFNSSRFYNFSALRQIACSGIQSLLVLDVIETDENNGYKQKSNDRKNETRKSNKNISRENRDYKPADFGDFPSDF